MRRTRSFAARMRAWPKICVRRTSSSTSKKKWLRCWGIRFRIRTQRRNPDGCRHRTCGGGGHQRCLPHSACTSRFVLPGKTCRFFSGGARVATFAGTRTAAGVTAGGVIGGTHGVLAGVGLLAIPGLGPFIAAGPIMAGLAGLGVGGAVGGLTGALIGLGIPEFEAKRYEGRLQKGGILLSVHCDTGEEIKRAKQV